jgi:hypothetical protein
MVKSRPQPLYPREGDPASILQEAGLGPAPSWTGGENLATNGIRSPARPARWKSPYQILIHRIFKNERRQFAWTVLLNLALAVISLCIIIIIIIIVIIIIFIIRKRQTWRNSQRVEQIRPSIFCELVLNFRTLIHRIQLSKYSTRRTL